MNDSIEVTFRKAAAEGSLDLVKNLIKKVDVNSAGDSKNTALHFSAQRGHIQIVRFLLKNGADCTLCNGKNMTAYDLAKSTNKIEVAKLLFAMQYGKAAIDIAQKVFPKEPNYDSRSSERDMVSDRAANMVEKEYDIFSNVRIPQLEATFKEYRLKNGQFTPAYKRELDDLQTQYEVYTRFLMSLKYFLIEIKKANHGLAYCDERAKIVCAFFVKLSMQLNQNINAEKIYVFQKPDMTKSHVFVLSNRQGKINDSKTWGPAAIYNDPWGGYLCFPEDASDDCIISRFKADTKRDEYFLRNHQIIVISIDPPEIQNDLINQSVGNFYRKTWQRLRQEIVTHYDALIAGLQQEAVPNNSNKPNNNNSTSTEETKEEVSTSFSC